MRYGQIPREVPTAVLSDARAFIWSGWLMLMELDGSDNPVRKYTWGLDLAGQSGSVNSLESAGGIGGLLAMQDPDDDGDPNDPNDFELNYVYAYDGNGNVGQLVKWELGYGSYWGDWHADRMVARYEYDPYGNRIGPDTDADGDFDGDDDPGPYAGENPFRFSTKYWDDETGLGNWPLRYYDPAMGRWTNRDPIEEEGGVNVYAYVANAPSSRVDAFGMYPWGDPWDVSNCANYCWIRAALCAGLPAAPRPSKKALKPALKCLTKLEQCLKACDMADNFTMDGEVAAAWFDPWEDWDEEGRPEPVTPLVKCTPAMHKDNRSWPPLTWPAPNDPPQGVNWVTCTWLDTRTNSLQKSQIQCLASRDCASCCQVNNPTNGQYIYKGCEDTPYFD